MNNETHETIADIVTEMRKRAEEVYVGQDGYPESWKDQMDYGEIYELSDRIEAAHKRERESTREKSSAVGNAAAMREALEKFNAVDLSWLEFPLDGDSSTIYNSNKKEITIPYWRVAELLNEVKAAQDMAKAALSAQPRNCDVGTADEQSDRFDKFCYSHSKCHKCPVKSIWNSQHRQKQLREIIRCEIIWSQMPYDEGGAK